MRKEWDFYGRGTPESPYHWLYRHRLFRRTSISRVSLDLEPWTRSDPGLGAPVTPLSHSLCLGFLPPLSEQTPTPTVKPSESIPSSPENPTLPYSRLYLCSVPVEPPLPHPGGEEKGLRRHSCEESSSPAPSDREEGAFSLIGEEWGRVDVRRSMALAQSGERQIEPPQRSFGLEAGEGRVQMEREAQIGAA